MERITAAWQTVINLAGVSVRPMMNIIGTCKKSLRIPYAAAIGLPCPKGTIAASKIANPIAEDIKILNGNRFMAAATE
jgi:hypothetical protein